MKRPIYILSFLVVLIISMSSCEKMFMKPNPETDNLSIYDEYWKLLDEKYAMWDNPDKKLDKEALHSYTRSLVNESLSQDSLFGVFNYIIQQLKDGHSWIDGGKNDNFSSMYDIELIGDRNYDEDLIDSLYLKNDYKTLGKRMKYKLLENGKVGYIEIRSWTDVYTAEEMDDVLNYFANTEGLIFDVRENGGGDPFMSTFVARHFADKEYYLGEERFKTGPGENDFSIQKLYNTPTSGVIYTKPVMVLTNRLCFSATTTFVYTLDPLPNVTFIGARTGGGSGSSADDYLANGWHWQMSTSEFIDRNGLHLDNGFDPDIAVALDTNDRSQDEIIERAIHEITGI